MSCLSTNLSRTSSTQPTVKPPCSAGNGTLTLIRKHGVHVGRCSSRRAETDLRRSSGLIPISVRPEPAHTRTVPERSVVAVAMSAGCPWRRITLERSTVWLIHRTIKRTDCLQPSEPALQQLHTVTMCADSATYRLRSTTSSFKILLDTSPASHSLTDSSPQSLTNPTTHSLDKVKIYTRLNNVADFHSPLNYTGLCKVSL